MSPEEEEVIRSASAAVEGIRELAELAAAGSGTAKEKLKRMADDLLELAGRYTTRGG